MKFDRIKYNYQIEEIKQAQRKEEQLLMNKIYNYYNLTADDQLYKIFLAIIKNNKLLLTLSDNEKHIFNNKYYELAYIKYNRLHISKNNCKMFAKIVKEVIQ